MNLITGLIIIGIFFAAAIVSGVFITKSAASLRGNNQEQLSQARRYLIIGSVVSWWSVAALIGGVILYIILGSETASVTGGIFLNILLGCTILLLLAQGGLAIAGAVYIRRSDYEGTTYRDSIIGASVALGTAGGVGIFILTYILLKKRAERKRRVDAATLQFLRSGAV